MSKKSISQIESVKFQLLRSFAGRAMVTDAGRANACRRKFKEPSLQTKVQKMTYLTKTWVLTGKQFEDFRRKKINKIHF